MEFKPKRFGMRVFDQLHDAWNGGLGILGRNEVEVAVAGRRAKIGYRSLIDAMGVDDNPARGGLPEHLGEAHHRYSARADDVGQHLPGSDGRQLIDISNDQQRCVIGNCSHKRLHQQDVDHRRLVDDEQIAIEGIISVAFEPAAFGIHLKQPVDRLGLDPGRFGHAFGRAAGRSAEQ